MKLFNHIGTGHSKASKTPLSLHILAVFLFNLMYNHSFAESTMNFQKTLFHCNIWDSTTTTLVRTVAMYLYSMLKMNNELQIQPIPNDYRDLYGRSWSQKGQNSGVKVEPTQCTQSALNRSGRQWLIADRQLKNTEIPWNVHIFAFSKSSPESNRCLTRRLLRLWGKFQCKVSHHYVDASGLAEEATKKTARWRATSIEGNGLKWCDKKWNEKATSELRNARNWNLYRWSGNFSRWIVHLGSQIRASSISCQEC